MPPIERRPSLSNISDWAALPLLMRTSITVPFASYTDGWGAHAFSDGNRREGDAGNRTISQKSIHRTWSRYYVHIAMKE